jgi:tetratricopeptide (TPR) repeat protein
MSPVAGQLWWIPVLFVAALAALLASFPVRNADLWKHLAAGRLLVQGGDPGLASVHDKQGWLYDLCCYGVYSAVGETGLVLGKVLLVVGLGLVLLRVSRIGASWPLAAACTALALLAMSMRVLLQPATVSGFFLALAYWFAQEALGARRNHESAGGTSIPTFRFLAPWPLLVLFLVWVNVDGWFLIGLGTVALLRLGRALDSGGGRAAGGLLSAAGSVLLLAAVCLLNPAHVRAFTPSPDLWHGTSPFQPAYFTSLGLSPAGLAYYPLLGLGLLTFLLNRSSPRQAGGGMHRESDAGYSAARFWERLLPWLGLAVLSAVQVRAIPFFAVVAGPVLAWNLQAVAAGRGERGEGRLGPRRLGPSFLLLLAACGLMVAAWPGWLQAPPFEPRHWGFELAPSLEPGAVTTRQWRQQGKLAQGKRGLHLSAESANAFAWFCPDDRPLLDDRLTAALLAGKEPPGGWDAAMRAAGVDHLIIYDPDRGRLVAALDHLFEEPERWPLLFVKGDLAVFGCRPAATAKQGPDDPFRGLELDLNRLAFRPSADQRAPRAAGPEPEPRQWWEALWKPAPPRSVDRDEAALYLLFAETFRRSAPYRRLMAWEATQGAAFVGTPAGWTGPLSLVDADLRLLLLRPPLPEKGGAVPPMSRLALQVQQAYALEQDDAPPALLYLAVRAARRAVANNPEDAQAYLTLGECYLRLLYGTRERVWSQRVPELIQLRRAQASMALNRAVAFNPDLAQAHARLADLYQELSYFDLALEHLRAVHELSRKPGAIPTAAAEAARREEEIAKLAAVVAQGERTYAAEAANLRVLDRALLAFQKGLAGKARDLLLESNVAAFGPQGMMMELELLLRTGRAKTVADWTLPEHQSALGTTQFHWTRAQALAASGDYDLAQEECDALAADARGPDPSPPHEVMAVVVGKAFLDGQPAWLSAPQLAWRALETLKVYNRTTGLGRGMKEEANANVFRGLLALEQGNVDEADVAFRLALALWDDDVASTAGRGLDFKTRPVAQSCLQWLE